MSATSLLPMLSVEDIKAAIDFYKKIGFDLTDTDEAHYGEGNVNWALLKFGDVSIMLSINGKKGEKPDLALFLNVDDVDAYFARVNSHVTIVEGLRDQFYGMRDFWFQDPFGFHWGAGSPIAEKSA